MHTTSSRVRGKRLFAKVTRVFRSGITSPWGRRHTAVLVGDRYLKRLRVRARVLDRHAKKHLPEGAWGEFECLGVGCSTLGTGVLGFVFQGHVNLEDLHITTAYKITHAFSPLSNEHLHSK